ncbi:MAG: carbohydrate ABC transporter permease [Candidatus Caccosoma sp.]|nr:carbohydrate ABC transporter permease [Candidatus Caccosoma sp.]
MTNRKIKEKVINMLLFIVALLISIFFALPFIYMILMSLMKSSNDIFTYPPKLYSGVLKFSNYSEAFKEINMGRLLTNTLIMVVSSMGIGITSSILVAYGFSRFKNKYSNIFFVILLSTMMIPWVVTMIPAYAEFEFLGWIGTRLPLIIPWIGGSAFNVFMLKQFMDDVPKDLDEAAKIDGANSFTILIKVLLPQITPCLATLLVYAFINSWSDYVGPSIYLQSNPDLYTLSLGMQRFFSSTGSANWTHVMAASVIFSLPMVLVLTCAQKAFVRGVVSSGIK